MDVNGQQTSDITLWLMIIIAVIAIVVLHKFRMARRLEREQVRVDASIIHHQESRFAKFSRYSWHVRLLLLKYPMLKKHPQIVENISLNTSSQLSKFDIGKHLCSSLADASRHEMIIRQAAKLAYQRDALIRDISNIKPTTSLEARLFNVSVSDCRRFEEHISASAASDVLEHFIVCYASAPASDDSRVERTFSMGFDDFHALCQSESSLSPVARIIQQGMEEEKNKYQKIPSNAVERQFISKDDFDKAYQSNYSNDRPGVYIILLYDPAISKRTTLNYSDVYVGQSLTVYHRVRQHFTGHGNGNVFADIKYGRAAYVKLVFCEESDLNRLEKKYIADYNATASYNDTKGGATVR